MSSGNSRVAPVWFMKVSSFPSVNTIPGFKLLCPIKIYSILSHIVITENIYKKVLNHWQKVMPLISFNWTDNANNENEYLWPLGVFCIPAHYHGARMLVTFHQLKMAICVVLFLAAAICFVTSGEIISKTSFHLKRWKFPAVDSETLRLTWLHSCFF